MADQSNEMGMVERVAVALYEAETSDLMDNWYSATDCLQDIYRRQARAAIEAMRTPTADMIVAGANEYDFTEDVVTNIYGAILDAALSHDEVKA